MSNSFNAFYNEFVNRINEFNEKESKARRDRRIVLKLEEEFVRKEQELSDLNEKIGHLNQRINFMRLKQMVAQGDLADVSIKEEKDKLALYQEEARVLSLRMQENKDNLEKAKKRINEVELLENKITNIVSKLKAQKEEIIESLSKIEQVKGKKCTVSSYKKEGETIEISCRYAHDYNAQLDDLKGINKALEYYEKSCEKIEDEPTVDIDWELVKKMSLKQKMLYFDDLGSKITSAPLTKDTITIESLGCTINKKDKNDFCTCLQEYQKASELYKKILEKQTVTIDWQVVNKLSNKEKADYFASLLLKIKNAPKVEYTKVKIGDLVEEINIFDKETFYKCYYEFNKAKEAYMKEKPTIIKPSYAVDWEAANNMSLNEKIKYFGNMIYLFMKKAEITEPMSIEIGNIKETINKYDEEILRRCCKEYLLAKHLKKDRDIRNSGGIDWSKVADLNTEEKANYYEAIIFDITDREPTSNRTEVKFRGDKYEINTEDLREFEIANKAYTTTREMLKAERTIAKRKEEAALIFGSTEEGPMEEEPMEEEPMEVTDNQEQDSISLSKIRKNICLDNIDKICKRPIKHKVTVVYTEEDENGIIKEKTYEFDKKYQGKFDKEIKTLEEIKKPKEKEHSDKEDIKLRRNIVAAAIFGCLILGVGLGYKGNKAKAAEKAENDIIFVDNTIETSTHDFSMQNVNAESSVVRAIGVIPENPNYSSNGEENPSNEKKSVVTPEGYVNSKEITGDEIKSDTKEVLLETEEIRVTIDSEFEEDIVPSEGIDQDSNGNEMNSDSSPEDEKDQNSNGNEMNSDSSPEDEKDQNPNGNKIKSDSSPEDEENQNLNGNEIKSDSISDDEKNQNLNDGSNLGIVDGQVLLETEEIEVIANLGTEENIPLNEGVDLTLNINGSFVDLETEDLQTKMENILLIHNYTRPEEEIINVAVDAEYDKAVDGYHLTYNNKTYPDMDIYHLTKTAHTVWRESKPGSYQSALASCSDMANRLEDGGFDYANDPYDIASHEGQYSAWTRHNIANSNTTLEEIPDYVLDAVIDCFYKGIRNNDYVYFKASYCTGPGKVQIVPGGNNHHGLAKYLARFDHNYEYEDSYVPGM